MLPAYVLNITIISKEINISEEQFRELTASSLNVLHSLNGAFDKKPCAYKYHHPYNSKGWSLRCALMISVGKDRGKYLLELYKNIANLIGYELPDFVEIQAEVEVLKFS